MDIFEFIGGRLCLDFCNTRPKRPRPPAVERLGDYPELLRWAVAANLLPVRDAAALAVAAEDRPREARRVLERAWKLREAFSRLVSGAPQGTTGDLELTNRELARALAQLSLAPEGGGFRAALPPLRTLESLLWPVARSMMELLTSADFARVRLCEAHEWSECSWLFLDDTKNHTRRWCSMADCGNRAKARRHYQRQKD